jgi:valyl-tRNA synthetase
MQNKGTIKDQMRQLGFALDWSKEKFTMDEDIVQTVYTTFEHLFHEGLVYRDFKLVNYCTSCGTSFSDLEVNDKETEGLLYHIKFPIKGGGEVVIATTRPETFVGDVAVMVHPKDKRYKDVIGKTVLLPLTNREIPIIADEYVDMKFGTGAVKVTPYHDFNDFEIAKKHKLEYPPVIGFDGKMQNTGLSDLDGLYVTKARKYLVEKLTEEGYLVKTEPHKMVLKVCYRCGTTLQPLPKEQWFINVKPLSKKAVELVEKDKIKVFPKRFKKQLESILENFIDWNISRQIVWGIRIPAYQCTKNGDWFVSKSKPTDCHICHSCKFVQDEDTFDTWFSSAQWPFATLQSVGKEYFDYFYPTSVMETGYDILRAWVARMIMIGYFETKKVPFENVFLHGMVRDKHGMKMSKSKGNVIDPLLMVDKYGADALRAALVFGTKEGGDVVLSEDKIIGMRNFGNKIWNIGRFIEMNLKESESKQKLSSQATKELKELEKEFAILSKNYHKHFEKHEFAKAFDETYEFIWHRFADYYIEQLKEEMKNGSMELSDKLKEVYLGSLRMLHPYMPFVTEAVWQSFFGEKESIMDSTFRHAELVSASTLKDPESSSG